jgi:hypothetical protein
LLFEEVISPEMNKKFVSCVIRNASQTIRVFEKKLWLQDNRSYTISVSAGPASFLPDPNTLTEISESM